MRPSQMLIILAFTFTFFQASSASMVQAVRQGDQLILWNEAISGTWAVQNGSLRWVGLVNNFTETASTIGGGSVFELVPTEGSPLRSSDFRIVAGPIIEDIAPSENSTKAADRLAGKQVRIELEDAAASVHVAWRAILR